MVVLNIASRLGTNRGLVARGCGWKAGFLNIRPSSITFTRRTWTLSAPWIMWGAVSAEVLIFDLLSLKTFAAMVGGAITASWCAVVERHAVRMEKSNEAHADAMGDTVLAADRFFDIGVRSNRIAMIDAADARSPSESGPYPIYRSGLK